jgi:putative transposase
MRLARIVAPGFPHHITQRGNRRAAVFTGTKDYLFYLSMLLVYSSRHHLKIWAYCLMPNHIHLVAVPDKEASLSCTLRDTHQIYARYFNEKTGAGGHLWQGRFYSTVMDEAHLWAAVRYIERNPVRASLTENPAQYRWSSAAAHCGLRKDALLSPDFPPLNAVNDWKHWLSEENSKEVEIIRERTKTGRPSGSDPFVEKLESLLKRDLKLKKRGRKSIQRNHSRN